MTSINSENWLGWTQWCAPYDTVPSTQSNNRPTMSHYTVDSDGTVPLELRASGPDDAMPPSPPNGGLYGGVQSTKPWANIPITPTATNYIQNNLKSALPPPGATEQYPSTNRLGNNYVAMPGVFWYRPETTNNLYAIKGVF